MKKVQIIEKSCHREGLKVQRMRQYFTRNGYELVNDGTGLDPTNKYAFPLEDLEISPEADVFVLTTCGFSKSIEDGDFDALKMIMKHKKEEAKVIVGGCIVKICPERLAEEFQGDTFDAKSYHLLDEMIEHDIPFEDIEPANYMNFTDNFFIKIQDGCNHRCAYCSIWKAAGKSMSKPVEDIIREFKHGLEQEHKKFYFLGECMGAYGLDLGYNLGTLLDEVVKLEGDFDLLIEDISPIYFLKNFKSIRSICNKKIIRSLHVPIQSGNDRIISLMNRKCDMGAVQQKLAQIKEDVPQIILSSAVIVGFPSETWDEMLDSLEYCRKAKFDTVACHVYSDRPGSIASKMEKQIDEDEKYRRYIYFKENFKGVTRVDPNQRKYIGE
jgi:MiaB/RimO family radical SAM methylthiotransferase